MVLVAGVASLRTQVSFSFLFLFGMFSFKVSKFIEPKLKFEEKNMCNGFGLDFGRQMALLDALLFKRPCCLCLAVYWLIGIMLGVFLLFQLVKEEDL